MAVQSMASFESVVRGVVESTCWRLAANAEGSARVVVRVEWLKVQPCWWMRYSSIVIGLLVALPGLSSNRVLKGFNRVYVELVRAVPILVMILWVYYGLPQLLDVSITVFWAGVIALALSDSCLLYTSPSPRDATLSRMPSSA